MGGLSAGRGKRCWWAGMTSSHASLYTQCGYVLDALCLSPSVMGALSSNKQSVLVHDVACSPAQSSGAANAAD